MVFDFKGCERISIFRLENNGSDGMSLFFFDIGLLYGTACSRFTTGAATFTTSGFGGAIT